MVETAGGTSVSVTEVGPLMAPAEAVTVSEPAVAAGAVYKPEEAPTTPAPLLDQANEG